MVDELVAGLRGALAGILPTGWRDAAPWGYPGQSELALVTGVFAAQLPPQAVAEIADGVMRRRPGSVLDDLADLAAIDPVDLRIVLGERWGDSTVLGVPRRRAEVIHEAARLLVHAGVRSAADLQEAASTRGAQISALLQSVRGLGPGTWGSIAFMAHATSLPDDAVVALVSSCTEADHPDAPLDRAQVALLIRLTAARLATDERVLSYALSRRAEELARTPGVLAAG
ncbi:hypothetical protein [Demequina gelatinilytica]|uniref:hypothetical protein n=1 Tax=Demequina gelatinilytica TaxID=1638980 RepID=UPI00078625DF|nr:hypothetical protein [Demequina gelatinilytica]